MKSVKILSLPSKRELNTLVSICTKVAASSQGTPFTMEGYWAWLEKSEYYKYVDFKRYDSCAIINFVSFEYPTSMEYIRLENGAVRISLNSTRLPFKTLEGAIEATKLAIDTMVGKTRERVDVQQLKQHYTDLFAAKAKGSGLRYEVFINASSLPWRGNVEVKLDKGMYLVYAFFASSQESAFESMARYAIEYHHLLEKYSKFNAKINI